ncbi:Glycerol-3-phosphate dehydrogenase [NAD(P)+] [Beijerinckiaceae bacterium RH AL1]|nr:NAD(P)-dependent glycerol-3-phosphate dehydrogenase [Beijerinckiaceae bacterium]VVB44067.1 Glycerol-3-phosphate dehydrogenase [NAD(P)+] [Beijerinckiaceae bacterium RH CH11]VVB44094.1 Glycerol-3-phosphate dehydrogenase [NAD(P)+] [Beijerinckiaceae bacterium RH AL8]VVC54154.1 Glycerol-3-phosphate dehydrogenase [NAD(P)+] [Beijerinckiaceae bacterium RH AL1]
MRRIAVLGAGAWGTALANLAARAGAATTLWGREPSHVAEMAATGVNARRLPGIPLVPGVAPTHELAEVAAAEIVLFAVPAQALRQMAERVRPHLADGTPVVACAKGIERGTGRYMSEVIEEVLPGHPPAVLSGPSFAEDVARGKPTAVTLAAQDTARAKMLAMALAAPWFRLYHSSDLRGVEIGGATKNVLAIACGIAAGKAFGASAGAALIARGFAELSRFGMANGARPGTLTGLSGLGDLVLTCGSTQSRNFSFGRALGEGMDVEAARAKIGTVEGAMTCAILCELARKDGIEMPIAQAVDAVLTGAATVDAMIDALLSRPARPDV